MDLDKSGLDTDTVEGELGVAYFLVNYFSEVHFQTPVAVHPCQVVPKGTTAN